MFLAIFYNSTGIFEGPKLRTNMQEPLDDKVIDESPLSISTTSTNRYQMSMIKNGIDSFTSFPRDGGKTYNKDRKSDRK